MDQTREHWWYFRKEDLISLAENEAPLFVYNEETLNEFFFDLSAMDVLGGLFYPFHINFHAKMLQKAFELDVHFRCNSLSQVLCLEEQFPKLSPGRIFFPADRIHVADDVCTSDHGIHVVVRNLKETLAVCKTLSRRFPNISTLMLDNDVGGKWNSHVNEMDIPEMENYLEAIHAVCPQFQLWLELPIHLLSYAGALLVEALESGTVEGMHYVRIRMPINDALHGEIYGMGHQVVNLFKHCHEKIVMTRIARRRNHAGDGIVYVKNPCPVEKGDILLLTHMGTYGPETRLDNRGRNGLKEWYLKARCLCPVILGVFGDRQTDARLSLFSSQLE